MCNPRRIRVRATREVALAWEQEVSRRAVRTGRATGEARVREALSGSVGRPTLAALAAVLGRTKGWEEDGDRFRHEIDGGYVAYWPESAELEIVAVMSAEVEASGEATETVRGEVTGTLEAEGRGTYFDDEWAGRDEATARREAEQAAEAALRRAADERVRQAREQATVGANGAVEETAARRAEDALAEATGAREPELREQAQARLAAIGVLARNLFHRALADAYRDVLMAYARSRGADGIKCSESGGVLEIEFEVEV